MPILILLKDHDHECRTYSVTDEKDARYQYLRRIEKESWYADRAFIVEGDGLPLKDWLEAEEERQFKYQKDECDRKEREEFERLKKKFEADSANKGPTEQ